MWLLKDQCVKFGIFLMPYFDLITFIIAVGSNHKTPSRLTWPPPPSRPWCHQNLSYWKTWISIQIVIYSAKKKQHTNAPVAFQMSNTGPFQWRTSSDPSDHNPHHAEFGRGGVGRSRFRLSPIQCSFCWGSMPSLHRVLQRTEHLGRPLVVLSSWKARSGKIDRQIDR